MQRTRCARALGALAVSALVVSGAVVGLSAPSQAAAPDVCAAVGDLGGTGVVGSPLDVTLPSWSLGVLSSTVDWLRNGTPFRSGGTSYTPVDSDAGQVVQVKEAVTLLGFINCTWVSNTVPIVAGAEPGGPGDPGDPGSAVLTLLSGLGLPASAQIGQLVTLSDPVWSLPGVTTSYQWLRDSAPISGATGQTYVATLADAGHQLQARATGALAGLPLVTALSGSLAIPLANGSALSPVGDVAIGGSRKVGTALTLSGPTWDPGDATNKYQWMRDAAPISGATAATYSLVPADFGHAVTVVVTGHKDGYTDNTITSDPVDPVVGDPIQFVMKPRITGAVRVGRLLTADPGQWTGGTEASGLPTYSYQWSRAGVAIPGAVAQTYQVDLADIGKDLTVLVTATRPAYKAGRFTTSPVAVARVASTVTAKLAKKVVKAGQKATMTVRVKAPSGVVPTGRLTVLDGRKKVRTVTLTRSKHGQVRMVLTHLKKGTHRLEAVYAGSSTATGASSRVLKLTVRT